jgi:Tfp pilus assembly protein FimT
MRRHSHITPNSLGYCLIELLLVLCLIGVCLAVGAASLSTGLVREQARGAAQSWQAGAAWAQLGVLWQGGKVEVTIGRTDLAVSHDLGLCGGNVGAAASHTPVSANVARWLTSEGARVTFCGYQASPDSGGSLFFHGAGGAYRIAIRPESGLTARSWVAK